MVNDYTMSHDLNLRSLYHLQNLSDEQRKTLDYCIMFQDSFFGKLDIYPKPGFTATDALGSYMQYKKEGKYSLALFALINLFDREKVIYETLLSDCFTITLSCGLYHASTKFLYYYWLTTTNEHYEHESAMNWINNYIHFIKDAIKHKNTDNFEKFVRKFSWNSEYALPLSSKDTLILLEAEDKYLRETIKDYDKYPTEDAHIFNVD